MKFVADLTDGYIVQRDSEGVLVVGRDPHAGARCSRDGCRRIATYSGGPCAEHDRAESDA